MKTKSPFQLNFLLVLLTLLWASNSHGYVQNVTNILAPGPNLVEKSATALTLATFQTAVATAWSNNLGGVMNFPTTITPNTNTLRGNYGTNGYRLQIGSSVTMQNITTSATSFTPASSPNATTSSANQSNYTLTLSLIDTNTGLPAVDQVIKQIGFVALSRGTVSANYPLDLRVTVTFSDDSTQVVTAPIANGSAADDTFFGFSAGSGLAIKSVRLQTFAQNTENPVADRIAWDDFGFVAGPSTATPQPQIINSSPSAFAITDATNGIQFNALTYENANPANISLTLNGTNVPLVLTGDPTNYTASFNGLLANQEYTMTINVTNSGGTATLTRTFYTYSGLQTLYDSESFTNDTLYPIGNLQAVSHGRGTWAPNSLEPATIVDSGGPQGKVLERAATGASRPDYLFIPPFSSGTIVYEFDAFVSTTAGRTIDVCLQPTTGGSAMASFIAWGEIPGKLAYFDNVNWIPLSDIETGWHHVKIINYLSGIAAGKFDILVNGVPVGQKISWRNPIAGAAFNQLRIHTQNTASIFQYGQIDDLIVTVAPEDPNVVLPPSILNLSPADRTIVSPPAEVRFDISSELPLANSNIVLRLNGTPVTLNFTGTANLLSASHTNIAVGNYVGEIRATNEAGVTTENFAFMVTDESWVTHPAAGWVGPWEWTSGMPTLESASPLDGSYLDLNATGGLRNFMRQYQSGAVDITRSHYIRWKFRVNDPDFDANFTVFNDRVHFFAHPVTRVTASTTTGNSWAIMAAGAASGGAVGGQTFWLFDNVEGNGTFNIANQVDTGVLLRPAHIYSFELLVNPENKTYSAIIVDQTGGNSFTSNVPHRFRDINPTNTHTFLHFGIQASSGTEARSFDLDSVFVTQAALSVTMLNPTRTGNTFSFSFVSQTGFNHAVQYRDSLSTGNWLPLETISGDGSTKVVTDINASPDTRYYRVITQ